MPWNSVEVEFKAMAHGIWEGMWLKQLLLELKIILGGQINILCDNQLVITIAKNSVHHDRTKQEIDRHFIQEKLKMKLLIFLHI